MKLNQAIHKLRTTAHLSQEDFAALFQVSQQAVQKWESGESTPEIGKIVAIAKYFGVSLDALVMGNDNRMVEELRNTRTIRPQYTNIHDWEFYSSNLDTEYQQSIEEGLDLAKYKELFTAAALLPKDETAKKLGDVLFDLVHNAPMREDYPYVEPSSLAEIQALREPYTYTKVPGKDSKSKVTGAWYGRICGCMLGKTVEGIRTNELIPFLKESGNYPMHRYIYKTDITEEVTQKYTFPFTSRVFADCIDGMPMDDDTNYTVLYQELIEKWGKDFTPLDVSKLWLAYQPKDAYCTAERVAFCNFVKGYLPPDSAAYQNPYREWIGAQIRADYFGYINPGNPALAAEMAWRDACVSHVKNGIYGEMFVAAMLAVAAETNDVQDIIRGGLGQIPKTSRLYADVNWILDCYNRGGTKEDCMKRVNAQYDEYSSHGWCHTNSNAMIVAMALLYGGGDYGKSVCMSVEVGYDTDCNGATVGSILGLANGIESIPAYWTEFIHDTLYTSIFGLSKIKISDRVEMTLKHIGI